jgi:hypothetical protein
LFGELEMVILDPECGRIRNFTAKTMEDSQFLALKINVMKSTLNFKKGFNEIARIL